MTSSKHLTNHAVLLGSLLIGLPMIPVAASATSIAQLPSQQSTPTDTITLPSGAMVQMTQIRVASVPPAPQNPCPSIYYENPYNQYVVVPQVCRPNLITQQLDQMGMLQSIRAMGSANVTTPGNAGTPYMNAPNTSY